MEGPLLTKNENITTGGNSSRNDEHNVNISINDDSSAGVEWRNLCTQERVWSSIEFILALVQIVAAILVLTRAKDEHPEKAIFVWIIGYTCGCFVILPVRISTFIYTRSINIKCLEEVLAYFFVCWAALLLWLCLNSASSPYDSTQHFWLCMAFLAFSIFRYVPVHPKCAAYCLIFVVVVWIADLVVGPNPNTIVYIVVLIVALGILKVVEEVLYLL